MRAENVGIENNHAGGAKALAGDAVIAPRGEPTGRDEDAADDRADR